MKKEAKTESKPTGQKARERTSTDDLTALRIRVAELLGWKPKICLVCAKCEAAYEADQNKDYSAGVFCPECRKKGYVMLGVCHPEPMPGTEMPDYPRDLNACHEFEKMLTSDEQKDGYYDGLCDVIIGGSSFRFTDSFSLLHATAEQRCRAFVKVMEGRSVVNGNENQGQDQG